LVRTPANEILLLRLLPTFRRPFWVTPGGGLDDGESYEEAAMRELREEVGRDDLALGPCVWTRWVEFAWESWRVRQRERTFVIEVEEAFEPVTDHPDAEPIAGGGWFTHEQIAGMDEVVYPLGLAIHLEELFRDGYPLAPIDLSEFVEH
jgi:8-oxo-dGTP pyrophosphatase MutT (NUDIX family)